MVDFFPAYEDLTEKQDYAMRHPGSMLVTGPPGSGKTVIALFRAHELKKKNRRAYVLTYGKVLMAYISKCLESHGIDDIEKSTFHSWFPKYYRNAYGAGPHKIDRFNFDWERIEKQFIQSGFLNAFDQLIIDEAQDLPVEFLRLSPYISESVTAFADENQAIFENNTSIQNIRRALNRFNPEHIQLKKNFRNTIQIARFSALFKTDGIETGKTDLPDRQGDLPLLCKMKDLNHQVKRICSYMSTIKTQNKTAGIFLPRKTDIRKWKQKLSKETKGTIIQYYISGEKVRGRWLGPPDFSKKGIFIVSDWTAKGLEFDYVFVPDMQKLQNNTSQIMRCYVAFSRAKDMLVMMYSGEDVPDIMRGRLESAESGGEEYVEKEGLKKIQKISEKVHLQKMKVTSTIDTIVLENFVEYCENKIDENSLIRMRKFFNLHFKDKNNLYQIKKIHDTITNNLPGKLGAALLSLLKQYIELTDKGEHDG